MTSGTASGMAIRKTKPPALPRRRQRSDAEKLADALYGQKRTKDDVAWLWFKNGQITRDGVVVERCAFDFSWARLRAIIEHHDGLGASSPPPKGQQHVYRARS